MGYPLVEPVSDKASEDYQRRNTGNHYRDPAFKDPDVQVGEQLEQIDDGKEKGQRWRQIADCRVPC